MKLITNRIQTGKPGRFEDFVKKFKEEHQIKTASVKVAEEKEEADSSGQLDVEPLHQEGESTTMPKAGPSAKKDNGEKSAVADTDPEKEGEDSGQPKAEGSEKFTNNVKFDPNDSSDEEKGIDASASIQTKVAATCEKCNEECDKCTCDGGCKCKACTTAKEATIKEAKGTVPESFKEHQFKSKDDTKEEEKEVKDKDKEKEAAIGVKEDKEGKWSRMPDDEAAAKAKEAKETKEAEKKAEQTPKFVKWANLDSKNKSFLTKYWRQLFGDDYVDSLVSDK